MDLQLKHETQNELVLNILEPLLNPWGDNQKDGMRWREICPLFLVEIDDC